MTSFSRSASGRAGATSWTSSISRPSRPGPHESALARARPGDPARGGVLATLRRSRQRRRHRGHAGARRVVSASLSHGEGAVRVRPSCPGARAGASGGPVTCPRPPRVHEGAGGPFRYFTAAASHARRGQLLGVTGGVPAGVTGAGCAGSVTAAGAVAGAAAAAVAPVIFAFCLGPAV